MDECRSVRVRCSPCAVPAPVGGGAGIGIRCNDIAAFLAGAHALIPAGTEHLHLDLDTLIHDLLNRPATRPPPTTYTTRRADP
ncbi:hypothetical protein EDD38_5434 [Kitasatospora cineracea]|uniref:Uncharacterized protein n=1 Tax=Kitasatospora cineracea TaxID=88074 RepID=A0A3N4RUM9_9ACTN|nr:hypothetical protein EDD38_5434 [Kitasatospora cineracea]